MQLFLQIFEKTDVLINFSMTLNKGDFLAITGASGSGKTTLLNILGLIDNFNSGCLKHFDNDISEASEIQKDKLHKEVNDKCYIQFRSYAFYEMYDDSRRRY